MLKIALPLLAATLSTSALAAANCPKHPKEEWLPQADAKARIEAQGYAIKKFKVDGQCYEIYGTNKEGKKVEIYSLPYSSINMWSSENAGKLDFNSEMELWTKAGHIKIKLGKGADVRRLDSLISWAVLKSL